MCGLTLAAMCGLTLVVGVFSSSGTLVGVSAAKCGLTLRLSQWAFITLMTSIEGGFRSLQPTVVGGPKFVWQPTSEKMGASCSRACQNYNNSRRISKFTSCGIKSPRLSMISWHSLTCLIKTLLHVILYCTSSTSVSPVSQLCDIHDYYSHTHLQPHTHSTTTTHFIHTLHPRHPYTHSTKTHPYTYKSTKLAHGSLQHSDFSK